MKILHIGKYFAPFNGGIEQVNQSLAEHCTAAGDSVRVLAHQHQRARTTRRFLPVRRTLTHPDEPVRRVLTRQNEYHVTQSVTCATLMFTPISPLFPWHLRQELKHNPDIIHIHMPNPSAFWLLLMPGAKKAKWVVHWHSDVIDEQASTALKLFYRCYRPFERWLLRKADAIVCTSPNYAKYSDALVGFQDKVRVVPLGIDVEGDVPREQSVRQDARCGEGARDGADARSRKGARHERGACYEILTVGRLTYYKGHKYLLEAIHRLKKRGVEVQWNIVGSGEEEANLKRLTKELELEERVHFMGRLSDTELQQQFTGCDVFCLPSIERTEAFGIVLMEAMRAEKSCIVTDVPGSGMSYVVSDGVNGRVVKRCDAEALATVIEHAVNNPELWQQLGTQGRLRLEQLFRSDVVAAQMRTIYHELV
ncbi:glycosyltransferase [Idiomarina seosinensis]|uniref:glycosyltransferase n=1 Tax=Idiomarina seosinensis TaxID=281739 RepID=UPI00384D90F6